jgi:serine/threonine protein kinase
MVQGSIRWQAPEIVLDDENNQKLQLTFASDVWSFGCTAYEVGRQFIFDDRIIILLHVPYLQLLTGNLPYHNRLRDFSVIQDLIHGVKPGAPNTNMIYAPGPQDKIWQLLDRCWSHQPYMRPLMMDVEAEMAMENMRY